MLYYSVDELRKALGMPLTDKHEQLKELEGGDAIELMKRRRRRRRRSKKPRPSEDDLEILTSDLLKIIEDYKSEKRHSERSWNGWCPGSRILY